MEAREFLRMGSCPRRTNPRGYTLTSMNPTVNLAGGGGVLPTGTTVTTVSLTQPLSLHGVWDHA